MCHYCGCRQVPLIRDYIAEHERITVLCHWTVKALGHGNLDVARGHVEELRPLLARHWQGEERGVFVPMAQVDEATAEYVAALVEEHEDLGAFLAGIDLTDPDHVSRFLAEVRALEDHIAREEDGVFPATLVTLSGAQWDAAMDAWHEAHPGEELIQG